MSGSHPVFPSHLLVSLSTMENTQSLMFDQYIWSPSSSFRNELMSEIIAFRFTLFGHPWKKSHMGYDLALVCHVNDPMEHKFRARLSSRFIPSKDNALESVSYKKGRPRRLAYLSPQKTIDCTPGPAGDAKVVERALSAPDADRVVLDTRRTE